MYTISCTFTYSAPFIHFSPLDHLWSWRYQSTVELGIVPRRCGTPRVNCCGLRGGVSRDPSTWWLAVQLILDTLETLANTSFNTCKYAKDRRYRTLQKLWRETKSRLDGIQKCSFETYPAIGFFTKILEQTDNLVLECVAGIAREQKKNPKFTVFSREREEVDRWLDGRGLEESSCDDQVIISNLLTCWPVVLVD